jgi:hypothetical protein
MGGAEPASVCNYKGQNTAYVNFGTQARSSIAIEASCE